MGGSIKDPYDVALDRLKITQWIIYSNTTYKNKINIGDNIYIYVGKTNSKNVAFTYSVIASAEIDNIQSNYRNLNWFEMEEYYIGHPYKILNLKNIKYYKKPFNFKINFKKISFMTGIRLSKNNRFNWGAYMQGGVKILTDQDSSLF